MWRRILFDRSGGHYIFWTGALYFAVGMYCIFVNGFVPVWVAQVTWVAILALPFVIPPFGRWINLDVTWDLELINRFKKEEKMDNNVYDLPKPKLVPPIPQVPAPLTSAKQTYSIGIDSDGNTILTIYTDTARTSLTMNDSGVRQLIKMLEVNLGD
jgi:hypothetical protein